MKIINKKQQTASPFANLLIRSYNNEADILVKSSALN